MKSSTTAELLAYLAGHLGMPGLRLDVAGCCQLAFDQRWLVSIIDQGAFGRIALHCPISAVHSASALTSSAMLAMLQANFMGRGTGRCYLAVNPEGRVCLVLDLALTETDASVLVNALEQLLMQAETWCEWLERKSEALALPLLNTAIRPASLEHLPSSSGANPAHGPSAGTSRLRDWAGQRV